jgi:hypothetical protein
MTVISTRLGLRTLTLSDREVQLAKLRLLELRSQPFEGPKGWLLFFGTLITNYGLGFAPRPPPPPAATAITATAAPPAMIPATAPPLNPPPVLAACTAS